MQAMAQPSSSSSSSSTGVALSSSSSSGGGDFSSSSTAVDAILLGPTSVAYLVEAIIWGILTLTWLLFYGATLLALRFSPKKKVASAKLAMLIVALVSAILNIPRTFDLSGVYGNVSFDATNFLHNAVTALHLLCLNIFIMSTARALYLQLQKPIPTFFIVALIGSNVFYFFSIVVLNALTITSDHGRDYINLVWALKGLAFDATMALIIAINVVLFVRLYRRLSKFIRTVESQGRTIEANKANIQRENSTVTGPPNKREQSTHVTAVVIVPPSPEADRSLANPMRSPTNSPGGVKRTLTSPETPGHRKGGPGTGSMDTPLNRHRSRSPKPTPPGTPPLGRLSPNASPPGSPLLLSNKGGKNPAALLRVKTGGLRLDAKLDAAAGGAEASPSGPVGSGDFTPLEDMVSPIVANNENSLTLPVDALHGLSTAATVNGATSPEPASPPIDKRDDSALGKKRTSSSGTRRGNSAEKAASNGSGGPSPRAGDVIAVARPGKAFMSVDTAEREESASSVPGTPSRPTTPLLKATEKDKDATMTKTDVVPFMASEKPTSEPIKPVPSPTAGRTSYGGTRLMRQTTTTPNAPASPHFTRATTTMRVQPRESPTAGGMPSPSPINRAQTNYQRTQTTNSGLQRATTMGSRVGPASAKEEAPVSSHEQRIKELKGAVRTLSFLSGCVIVLGILCIAFDLPDSVASLAGSYADDSALYGPRRDEYSIMSKAFQVIQNINLAVVVWYCWTPWLFLPKHRAHTGITFLEGLKNGMEVGNSSKYEREPQSKRGGGMTDSQLKRMNTMKSVNRTASMGGGPAMAAVVTAAKSAKDAEDRAALGGGAHQNSSGSLGAVASSTVVTPLHGAPPTAKKAWGSMGGAGAGGTAAQMATIVGKPDAVYEEETSLSA